MMTAQADWSKAAPIPSFQEFMEEHRTVVYRFLMASVGPADADDVFQETFLAALKAYPRLREDSNLRGWVLAIATRKAIDAGRSRSRRALPVAHPDESAARSAPAEDVDAFQFDAAEPLWLTLRELPDRQRAAVVHRVVLDRSYSDVAAAMDCSEETARSNVYQGLRKLREKLGEG